VDRLGESERKRTDVGSKQARVREFAERSFPTQWTQQECSGPGAMRIVGAASASYHSPLKGASVPAQPPVDGSGGRKRAEDDSDEAKKGLRDESK
jgi:hypothetical protein